MTQSTAPEVATEILGPRPTKQENKYDPRPSQSALYDSRKERATEIIERRVAEKDAEIEELEQQLAEMTEKNNA